MGSGFQVGTPKSGFRANWAKLGAVTVLKKEILKVDDLDNILTKTYKSKGPGLKFL